jgi:hypothetical protein
VAPIEDGMLVPISPASRVRIPRAPRDGYGHDRDQGRPSRGGGRRPSGRGVRRGEAVAAAPAAAAPAPAAPAAETVAAQEGAPEPARKPRRRRRTRRPGSEGAAPTPPTGDPGTEG